jgi:hypothetical protein
VRGDRMRVRIVEIDFEDENRLMWRVHREQVFAADATGRTDGRLWIYLTSWRAWAKGGRVVHRAPEPAPEPPYVFEAAPAPTRADLEAVVPGIGPVDLFDDEASA